MKKNILGFFIFLFFFGPQVEYAISQNTAATLVRTINTYQFTPSAPDAAGITYIPPTGRLIISDSEVDEMPIFANANLFEITTAGTLIRTGNTTTIQIPSYEPTGITYNTTNGHLYFSDDDYQRIFELISGSDGVFGTSDDTVTYFSTSVFGATDPEGITAGLGNLFIADGINHKVYQVTLTGNLVNSFDTAAFGQQDLEGITYNLDTGTLFILSLSPKIITETTIAGLLIRKIDISTANSYAPADLTFAPTSSTSDDPNIKNLYLVDRGVDNNENPSENDGKMYELSVPGLPLLTITPTPTQTANSNCQCLSGACTSSCEFDRFISGVNYSSPIKCSLSSDVMVYIPTSAQLNGWCKTNFRTKGDSNADGIIDLTDYFYYISAVVGGKIPPSVDPDFDGDGLISTFDRSILMKSIGS